MQRQKAILCLQGPPGSDFHPIVPFLDRCGDIEYAGGSTLYLADRRGWSDHRWRRRLRLIRSTVQAAAKVPVRIGVAQSKSVSLIAARRSSPGGVTIVEPGREQDFLDRILIDLMPGLGRRSAAYLRNRGVMTIGAFARLPQIAAVRLFGRSGIILREYSLGRDPRDILPTAEQQPVTGRRSLFSMFVAPRAAA